MKKPINPSLLRHIVGDMDNVLDGKVLVRVARCDVNNHSWEELWPVVSVREDGNNLILTLGEERHFTACKIDLGE